MAHTPITGYRELSEKELEIINSIKGKASELEALLQWTLADHDFAVDSRWYQLGLDNIQTGLMQVIRSITRPEGF